MAYEYELWLKRAKKNNLTPLWTALSTLIFAPLGYWFNGDGFKGLRYSIVIFFAGYVTLSIATIIGSLILMVDVYRVSAKNETVFTKEKTSFDYSQRGWLIKTLMIAFLIIFILFAILFSSII
jgi:hypothetical protein